MVTSATIDLRCRKGGVMKLSPSECVDGTSPRLEVSLGVYCTRTYISPALTTNGCKSRLKAPAKRFRPCQPRATPRFLEKKSYRSTSLHQRGWKVRLRSWLTIYVIYICLCAYIPIFRCSLFCHTCSAYAL